MARVLFCMGLLILAACKAQDAPTPSGSEVPEAPSTGSAQEAPAAAPPASAQAVTVPSFDCAKAASDAEKLVCGDAELAALDRQLSERYASSSKKDPATERGWIKGRDDCWKEEDARSCVRDAYRTRLVELAINAPDVMVPKTVEFRCTGNTKPFAMVFYNDIDPAAAVMTWGNDQAIVFPQPAASGAKYGRTGIEYWEHQGEASVDFYGNRSSCKPLP